VYLTPFLYLLQKAAKTRSKLYLFKVQVIWSHHFSPSPVFLVDTPLTEIYNPDSASKNYLSPPIAVLVCHPHPFRIWN